MSERYVARSRETQWGTLWGVYDTEGHGWAAIINGKRIPNDTTDKAAVEKAARELNGNDPEVTP